MTSLFFLVLGILIGLGIAALWKTSKRVMNKKIGEQADINTEAK
jgi:hypothetical protein